LKKESRKQKKDEMKINWNESHRWERKKEKEKITQN
jgi:hypothetical protein